MTPPEQGISTNIGQNFAETLQFQDPAVTTFFSFYYMHIFVNKILNWCQIHFLLLLREEKKLKHFAEKSNSAFEGFKGGPFKYTQKNFFPLFIFIFCSIFIKNLFLINSIFFSQKYTSKKI